MKLCKIIILINIIMTSLGIYENTFCADKKQELAVFAVPEVNEVGDIIALRVMVENNTKKSKLINKKDVHHYNLRISLKNGDGSRTTLGKSVPLSWRKLEGEFIELKPNEIYGKTIRMPKEKLEYTRYMKNQIVIYLDLNIDKTIDEEGRKKSRFVRVNLIKEAYPKIAKNKVTVEK